MSDKILFNFPQYVQFMYTFSLCRLFARDFCKIADSYTEHATYYGIYYDKIDKTQMSLSERFMCYFVPAHIVVKYRDMYIDITGAYQDSNVLIELQRKRQPNDAKTYNMRMEKVGWFFSYLYDRDMCICKEAEEYATKACLLLG